MRINLLNGQSREELDRRDDGALDIVNVFETIQGEGPHVGTPSVFVRVAGCNLTCPGCDTDYTSNRCRMSIQSILDKAQSLRPQGLVVITGGEPYRQDLRKFTDELIRVGYTVQIETNGTLFQDLNYNCVDVVCSPKTPNLHPSLIPYISALKYIVQKNQVDIDGLPLHSLGMKMPVARIDKQHVAIYVQPMDEQDAVKNDANLRESINSCMKFGYKLCLQVHKIIGME